MEIILSLPDETIVHSYQKTRKVRCKANTFNLIKNFYFKEQTQKYCRQRALINNLIGVTTYKSGE